MNLQLEKKTKKKKSDLTRVIKWLTGNPGSFTFAVAAVIAQGFHYFLLFFNVLESEGVIASVAYSSVLTFVLAGSLLAFTLTNTMSVVRVFMVIDIAVNLSYYYRYVIVDKFKVWEWELHLPEAIIFLIISLALPYVTTKYAGRIKV